jgi:hypothetical protein
MKKLFVILIAVAMVGAFAATSMAAEWNFYGSSRMNTVYYDKSKETAGDNQVYPPEPANFDDQDMTWTTQSNARIGAKVKSSDAVSGRFEFQVGSAAEVKVRLMYGAYNFGAGTLVVGQDYTPVDQILSSSIGALSYQITGTSPVGDGEGDALTIGSFYESRQPQVKLKFGNLQLAFITMKSVGPIDPDTAETSTVYTDIDTTIPKVEVNYTFKTDAFSITPYAGYNTVDFTNPADDNSVSVDSYVLGAAGKVNFGPMSVKANVFWAQNADNYGTLNNALFNGAVLNGTDTEDASTWGGQVIAGFKLSDMLAFEAGYSYEHNEVDVAAGITGENDPSHWYVNATITLAPGVYIVPEVGMFDFGDAEITGEPTYDRGDATYYGAKWQINF